jgi:hypothetical protein
MGIYVELQVVDACVWDVCVGIIVLGTKFGGNARFITQIIKEVPPNPEICPVVIT